jgi:hypothetical protein
MIADFQLFIDSIPKYPVIFVQFIRFILQFPFSPFLQVNFLSLKIGFSLILA